MLLSTVVCAILAYVFYLFAQGAYNSKSVRTRALGDLLLLIAILLSAIVCYNLFVGFGWLVLKVFHLMPNF